MMELRASLQEEREERKISFAFVSFPSNPSPCTGLPLKFLSQLQQFPGQKFQNYQQRGCADAGKPPQHLTRLWNFILFSKQAEGSGRGEEVGTVTLGGSACATAQGKQIPSFPGALQLCSALQALCALASAGRKGQKLIREARVSH